MSGIELFTIGTAAVTLGDVLMVGGALASASGAVQSGEAQANAARYNADLAKMESQAESERRRRAASRKLGAVRAGRAKSGVTTEGTPLMVMAESAEMGELDALTALWSGDASARLYNQQAKSAKKAIPYAVGSSLLTGASRIGRSIT